MGLRTGLEVAFWLPLVAGDREFNCLSTQAACSAGLPQFLFYSCGEIGKLKYKSGLLHAPA